MSGGSHNYAYCKLNDIAADFDYKEIGHLAARQKVAKILRLMAEICHDIEWIDSGDYGESDWVEVEKKLARIKLANIK